MRTTLRFDDAGRVACLYTEAVDLRALGRLQVVRATDIRFNALTQLWEVHHADNDEVLFSDPSRAACLAWEQDNLQPGTPDPQPPTRNIRPTMKKAVLVTLALAGLLAACGPSKSELRAELRAIDTELVSLRVAAEQHRAQMSQAEFDAFIGSFAAGYGAVSGDYGLAGDGVGTAIDATNQANAASYSLDQIKQRHDQLAKRRAEIVGKLD
jgi:hypothetical protein